MKSLAGVGALGVVLVGCGCSASHPTAMWSARPVFNNAAPTTAMGSSSSVVFSPGLEGSAVAFGPGSAGFDRNDDLMSIRDVSRRDELLGIPGERLPSLDHRGVYRGARRAEDYVYPGVSGYGARRYRWSPGYGGGYRGYDRRSRD